MEALDQSTKLPASVVFGFSIGESFSVCGQKITQVYHSVSARNYLIKSDRIGDMVETNADFALWLISAQY